MNFACFCEIKIILAKYWKPLSWGNKSLQNLGIFWISKFLEMLSIRILVLVTPVIVDLLYFYMVELQETENPIFAIIDTMYRLMSRQHLGLTTQFPSKGLTWMKVHTLAKWITMSEYRTAITYAAIEVHDHYTTAPLPVGKSTNIIVHLREWVYHNPLQINQ